MRLAPLALLLACEPGTDTGDTGSHIKTPPADADTDADTDTDTDDTDDTDDTAPKEPELEWTVGSTGLRMDLSYDGNVGGDDVVRVGLWLDEYRAGAQLEKIDTTASFPKTLEVDLPELGKSPFQYEVYLAAYIDRNNDHYHYPGPEDLVLVYGPDGLASYPVLIKDGYLTTGVELAFYDPY